MTSPEYKQLIMAPLTAEDRLLIKCLRTEKGWTVWQNDGGVSGKTAETADVV